LDLDFKKIQICFAEKIWVENLIQLFGSKLDVGWIIKNSIHAHLWPKVQIDQLGPKVVTG